MCNDPVTSQWFGCLPTSHPTVQHLAFSADPVAGSFVLNFGDYTSLPIAYNAVAQPTIDELTLNLIPGLEGLIAGGAISLAAGLNLSFYGYESEADLFTVSSNTTGVTITVTKTQSYQNNAGLISTTWASDVVPTTTWTPCVGY